MCFLFKDWGAFFFVMLYWLMNNRLLKLLYHRRAFRLTLAVVDDTVDYAVIIFQHHFRITERRIRQKVVQFQPTIPVHIMRCYDTVYFERHNITCGQAMTIEVLGALKISFSRAGVALPEL